MDNTPEVFVPLTPALPEHAREHRTALAAAADTFTPFRTLVSASAAAVTPNPNEPRLTIRREGDRITAIQIECTCGQVIELACTYDLVPPETPAPPPPFEAPPPLPDLAVPPAEVPAEFAPEGSSSEPPATPAPISRARRKRKPAKKRSRPAKAKALRKRKAPARSKAKVTSKGNAHKALRMAVHRRGRKPQRSAK